jgi:hypothetical protein
MCSRILIAAACLALAAGCAKRTAKKPSQDDSANAKQPAPAPGADDRKNDKKGDEPNWLTDSRFKKDPPSTTTPLPPDGSSPGKQPWAITPPQGGWQGPNPGAGPVQPAAPGGMPVGPAPVGAPAAGMGVLQPQPAAPAAPGVPPAQNKRVEQADMKDVWIYIENASGASGKMPTQKMIYEALLAAKSPAAELVRTGAIYLTGSTSRESIWAFEAQALASGGLVANQNGVETLTAAELKSRLGK